MAGVSGYLAFSHAHPTACQPLVAIPGHSGGIYQLLHLSSALPPSLPLSLSLSCSPTSSSPVGNGRVSESPQAPPLKGISMSPTPTPSPTSFKMRNGSRKVVPNAYSEGTYVRAAFTQGGHY